AQPHACQVHIFETPQGAHLGVFAAEQNDGLYRVRALRVRGGGLGQTLACHLLWRAVTAAVKAGFHTVLFEDPFVDGRVIDALKATGFLRDGNRWAKIVIRGALGSTEIPNQFDTSVETGLLSSKLRDDLADALRLTSNTSGDDIVRLEHILWP